MYTRLAYFRPDKRFVSEDLLDKKYSCVVIDELSTAENTLSVPIYLTVFQHYEHKSRGKLLQRRHNVPSDKQLLGKLGFHLVGSKQTPPMQEYTEIVDRVEFHGHIGFEEPVFEIIHQLPKLRKVGFYINPIKQGNFTQVVRTANVKSENQNAEEKPQAPPVNKYVTSAKIIMGRVELNTSQKDQENCISTAKKESLRIMVIRLLRRIVEQCPNIKRLTIDVPNWKGIRKVLEETFGILQLLKFNKLSFIDGRLILQKSTDELQTNLTNPDIVINNHENDNDCDGVTTTTSAVASAVENSLTDSPVPMIADPEQETNTPLPETELIPDNNPCLTDMSKLLGSMLGIPSSSSSASESTSLPSPALPPVNSITQLSKSDGAITLTQSDKPEMPPTQSGNSDLKVTNNTINVPLPAKQKVSLQPTPLSSSSTEIISYAAAAASAAITSTTANNNNIARVGNGSQHRRCVTNNSEGSRRAFLRDGDGLIKNDEESRNRRKPSNAADLGKPVFPSSCIIQQKNDKR